MHGRPSAGRLAQSPLEIVAIPLLIGVVASVGLLWGTGVVIGSIIGSSLPGTPGESVFAMLGSFPDVGAAWKPAIPSLLIWAVTIVVMALLAPLIWKLTRVGRLSEEGAQWATSNDLRRAGLLIADRSLSHAVPESQEVADAS
ncbi:MAG: hypothetical protein ACC742_14995 [Thermoanaerobaculales bacterium]